jgi:hypothetical protein
VGAAAAAALAPLLIGLTRRIPADTVPRLGC